MPSKRSKETSSPVMDSMWSSEKVLMGEEYSAVFVSAREVIVLGSASQVPTRQRNHNGYLVRFDDQLVLFDPGEGIQRQATIAGEALARLTAIAVTHFHGDHCLGLPGVIQRLNGERVARLIPVFYPAAGQQYFDRLRYASEYLEVTPLEARPIGEDAGGVGQLGELTLTARKLDHRTDTFGYRLEEPARRRFLPERLTAAGIAGPMVGELLDAGEMVVAGRTVTLDEVSEVRPGQVVAVVMDTRVCDGARQLAAGADLLVIESTFLDEDRDLADQYAHLTARQAGEIAETAGVRSLVLTHFSQRYRNPTLFLDEAATVYSGPIHVAADFDRIPVPRPT